MRLRLKPYDTSLFELLTRLAETLPPAADLLAQALAAAPGSRAGFAQRLTAAEGEAADAARAVMRRIAETFVTPFDRDDLYTLVSRLGDCIDAVEEVSDRITLYRVGEVPPGMVEQVQVIQRCAELTATAVPQLKSTKGLADYWVEINALENRGDALHRSILASIFDGTSPAGDDPIEVLKFKDLADDLEAAIDAFEKVSRAIETIVLKEA